MKTCRYLHNSEPSHWPEVLVCLLAAVLIEFTAAIRSGAGQERGPELLVSRSGGVVRLTNKFGKVTWSCTNSFFDVYQQSNEAKFLVTEHTANGKTNRFYVYFSLSDMLEQQHDEHVK